MLSLPPHLRKAGTRLTCALPPPISSAKTLTTPGPQLTLDGSLPTGPGPDRAPLSVRAAGIRTMPPKRKRPSDIPDPHPKPSVTRRATRQTPVPPPPVPASVLSPLAPNIAPPTPGAIAATTTQQQQPQLQPRLQSQPQSQPQPPYKQPRKQQHKKLLPNVSAHPVTAVPLPSIIPKQQKRGRLRQPISVPAQDQTIDQEPSLSPGSIRVALPPPRRVARVAATETAADGREMGSIVVKENIRPSDLVAPEITYHVPHINQTGRQSSLVRPHGPSAPPPRLDMMTPLIVTPVPPPRHPMSSSSDRPPPRPDRNIDKVVLGNLCFRTWYPSYYGKEILGDTSANVKGGFYDGAKEAGSKAHAKKDKDHQPMLDRLYVCPSCFKYAKEIVAWWGHVRLCQRKGRVPGRKIYVHPRGRRTVLVAYDASKGPGPKKRRGENGPRYVEETVQDEGEWSVWEVDGEEDGVSSQLRDGHPQNLSVIDIGHSSFVRTFHCSLSYFLTTNRYFLMLRASTIIS